MKKSSAAPRCLSLGMQGDSTHSKTALKEGTEWYRLNACRICGNPDLFDFLSLGEIPVADRLLRQGETAPRLQADVCFCPQCSLVQLRQVLDPKLQFTADYPYFTSVSSELRNHFQQSADRIAEALTGTEMPFVIEAASNDGFLLSRLNVIGFRSLGIEPAAGPAMAARQAGVETDILFFGADAGEEYRRKGLHSDAFIGNNVIAHVPDPLDFVKGIEKVLKPDGIVVLEFPWVLETFQKTQFDQIFHQHYSYFSLHAIQKLFDRVGLRIHHAEKIPIHGGSLRVFLSKHRDVHVSVNEILKAEREAGLFSAEFYVVFAERVKANRDALRELLFNLCKAGKRIAGYGAAGKASTLLAYCGIGKETLYAIADISPHKQGRLFPAGEIPIVSPGIFQTERPDYILILAWNFADAIMHQLTTYHEAGTRFILPVPVPKIVDGFSVSP